MPVEPYLYFNGKCEEALNYYVKTLGAERLAVMRFNESPDDNWQQMTPAENGDKIMHSAMRVGGSMVMMSDGMCNGGSAGKFENFALTLSSLDTADTEKFFNALAAQGKIMMPLSPTFFAKKFGMVVDPYGVCWILITPEDI